MRSCYTNPKHTRPFNALQHPKQILIWQSLIARHKKPPQDGRAAVAARTDQGGRLFSEIWSSRRVLYPYVPGVISGQARSSRTPCEQRRRGTRNGRNFLPALCLCAYSCAIPWCYYTDFDLGTETPPEGEED